MRLLLIILRSVAGLLGGCLAYLAAFTYETTDKRIQNWLEDLWLRFAYDARGPSAIAERLARVVLTLLDKILDRVFGISQLSVRTISVALCYAYAPLLLSFVSMSLFARLAGIDPEVILRTFPALAGRVAIIMAATFLVFGSLPAIHASLRWITYFAAICIVLLSAVTMWLVLSRRPEATAAISAIQDPGELVAGLVVALVWGVGMLHAIRYGIRKTVRAGMSRRDLTIVSSVIVVPLLAFGSLGLVSVLARRPRGYLTVWLSSLLSRRAVMFFLFTVAGSISAWGIGFFIIAVLTGIVLLHIIVWPGIRFLLMKMVYAAQRHQVITTKAKLWSTSCSLLACAAIPGELWKLVRFIISKMR